MRLLVLFSLLTLGFAGCTKKKLNGRVSYAGLIRDAYNNQALPGIRIGLGEYHAHSMGRYYKLKKMMVTGPDGRYFLEDTLSDRTAVFVAILDSSRDYTNSALFARYDIRSMNQDVQDNYLLYEVVYAKGNQQDIDFTLKRIPRIQYTLKRNPNVSVDTINIIGYQYVQVVVTKDTVVYQRLKPGATNQIELRHRDYPFYKESIQTTLAGDTIYRTIQL